MTKWSRPEHARSEGTLPQALGADAWTLSPEQFDAYIKDEIKSNAVLVKAAGLQVQQ
jgi:tripartite-type tricarboxylate transporter receptor subunit TctC